MKTFKENDFQILERLISLKQKQVKKTVSTFLKKKYPKVIETQNYVIAAGDIPIALVAHLDTVWERDKVYKRDFLYYDAKRGVMWHPQGAGFDDRAGVFAILKIIRDGYKPHVIFTTDEELGGVGAVELTTRMSKHPFDDLKYIIELDRANTSDCVFYNCFNQDFIKYVESFGFVEDWGTFSDIDVICPDWGIAGVNLSVGYEDEHTTSEILRVNALLTTIERIKRMLEDADSAQHFKYIVSPFSYYSRFYPNCENIDFFDYYNDTIVKCDKCGQYIEEFESIPVKTKTGGTVYRCCDCIVDDNIGWCHYCGEAFEKENSNDNLCRDCKDRVWQTGTKKKLKKKLKK